MDMVVFFLLIMDVGCSFFAPSKLLLKALPSLTPAILTLPIVPAATVTPDTSPIDGVTPK
jgi:hypothetical protein